MKRIAFILAIVMLAACTADNVTPTSPSNDTFDPKSATLLKSGVLMGVNHTVSGQVGIYDDKGAIVVLLDPYDSESGPDLKVYLSKDADASDYIKLGNLKSTKGKQSYKVLGTPDLDQYDYVHIWCERFTVVFGRAEVH